MTEINRCPSSLTEGFNTYSPKALDALFYARNVDPILDFNIDEFRTSAEIVDAMNRISVSGAQEKFPAIIREDKICISATEERSTHILKPAPWDKTLRDPKQIPANEHVTMQIASQVYGILTAANGLCFTSKGYPVYITRRFDISKEGTKLPMEDFATIIGKNEETDGKQYKYTGCYEDIAKAIRSNVAAWMVDMERFFELVVFNYIYANEDAHLKNFSLIRTNDGYHLSPAYDLLNTCLHINSNDLGLNDGLSLNIEKSDILHLTGHPCRLDFERFGIQIGLIKKRIDRILDKYTVIPDNALRLIELSYLIGCSV